MKSYNKEFCTYLEFHLCRTLDNIKDEKLKGFWCDGVSPDSFVDLTERKIETTAWLGKTGQDKYFMVIWLGNCSIKQLKNDESLIDCIPSEELIDWLIINTQEKTIEISLN